jgi:hypothetical protein
MKDQTIWTQTMTVSLGVLSKSCEYAILWVCNVALLAMAVGRGSSLSLDFSHACGEFCHIIEGELHMKVSCVCSAAMIFSLPTHFPFHRCYHGDLWTCWNCTNLHNKGLKWQLIGIVEAYITWQDTIGERGWMLCHHWYQWNNNREPFQLKSWTCSVRFPLYHFSAC